MSIQDLFNKKQASFENATTGSSLVESPEFIFHNDERKQTFIPNVDFSTASNFAKFGSAYEYYTTAIKRVYNEYPYDGSEKEKILFELSSSFLDKWIFDNQYPKSTGYVNFSYGGWGSLNGSISDDGYGLPSSVEYIYSRGGLHTASSGMIGKPLVKTFNKSIKYNEAKNRTTTFRLNMPAGFTVEFWMKKSSFDLTKTKKEVILDLWNSELSSSDDYGRFTLELSGTGETEAGTQTFRLTLQSGSNGFFDQTIGTTSITTGSLSSWSHYAFTFISASAGVISRFYVNGDLNEKKTLGSVGLNEVGGLINGYIGALQTSPSGSSAAQFSGKLDASLDDFRFWKTKRTSQQIYNNFYTHVGGGTNTDDANTTLGLYYKFNEGIVGDSNSDSIVLDYSGRIANGVWTGYSVGARNTGSAFISSSLTTVETNDPIIRSSHPEVVTLLSNLQTSGSEWDDQNTSLLYNRVPLWIREEDEDDNKNVKYLFQIIGSYFDTLHMQINELPKLKDKKFVESQYKALPFADRLLKEKGIVTSNILVDRSLFENYNNRDTSKLIYEKEVEEVKNLIYTNIYNNLEQIYKAKGTEKSIRNMLRCFGIDDEIVKLNVYSDHSTHYFKDNYKQTTIYKNYINFNAKDRFVSSVYQTASTNNYNTFVTGSRADLKESYSAFTAEANIIVPHKLQESDNGFFETVFLSSSIFGMHEAVDVVGDYTWATEEIANFQVYLLRDKKQSKNARFVIKNSDGTINLTSSLIREIYDNQTWNLAVRVKPDLYPYIGNVVTSSNPTYTIDFYGVNHAYGVIDNQFHLSASLSYTSGSAFLSRPKRFYVGAHKTNFTGSVAERSDLKVGSLRFYLDYVNNQTINQHNLDPSNYGLEKSVSNPTMFDSGSANRSNPTFDSKGFIWNFATVTGSDASGEFVVDDFSSGSTTISSNYPEYITKAYHAARGTGFPASSTDFIKSEIVFANKKELPEISFTADNVRVQDDEINYLMKDEDVSDNYFALEKSFYQVISDEMMKMFSTAKDFSNLMGKAVDRYRTNYKRINFIRGLFFDKVESDPDFDKFTEYFKWIDGSISRFVSQLFPVSARHSDQISDIVESHILERNKYQNKLPILTRHPSTEGQIRGSSELRYNWKTGHAPVDSAKENENCFWQKFRKERTDINQREILRKAIITEATGSHNTFAKDDKTLYEGSTFALRRLAKPYRLSQELAPTIHGGTNYPPQKDRDYVFEATSRGGHKGAYGQPVNVMFVGFGTGSGVIVKQRCDDVSKPNEKKKHNYDLFIGKHADDTQTPEPKTQNDTYSYRFGSKKAPINVISASITTGYNSLVSSSYKAEAVFVNLHSDTTTPTNHVPMQGPFTEAWVGGRQHRHIDINRYDSSLRDDNFGGNTKNNLQNRYTRPEGYQIAVGEWDMKTTPTPGAFGFLGADYGGPYPDPARKVAVYYREERAKRPVNIKNINYNTSSYKLGNYKETREIVSISGKSQNNFYLRKNPNQALYLPASIGEILPDTTHVMGLYGQAPYNSGNVFGHYDNNRQPDATAVEVIADVVGVRASGSITMKGRFHAHTNDTLQIAYSDSAVTKWFKVGVSSSQPVYGINTGSSDTMFWNNFTASVKDVYSNTYSITYAASGSITGSCLYSTASQHNHYLSGSMTGSSVGNNPSGSSFTFAGWYYLETAITQDRTMLDTVSPEGNNGGPKLVVKSDGHLYFTIEYSNADGSQRKTAQWKYEDFADNYDYQWTHVALMFNSQSSDRELQNLPVLYINSVSQSWSATADDAAGGFPSSYSSTVFYDPNTINHLFLFTSTNINNSWKGGIDEVMWFNAPLNAEDIESIYNCRESNDNSRITSLPSSSYCASWWTMGDHPNDPTPVSGAVTNITTTGTEIIDVIGNNNLRVKQGLTKRLHWSHGIPQSASYAIFQLTASTETEDQNRAMTRVVGTPASGTMCAFSASTDAAIAGGVTPVEGDVRRSHDVVMALRDNLIDSKQNKTVITSRFSAPGGIEVQSPAFLDVYAREFSVHNALPYRNLTVRGSGSGESHSIRLNDHLGNREGLRTHLSRHSGKFGSDSVHGSVVSTTYVTKPSLHKTPRNISRKPTSESTGLSPVFNEDHDNAFVSSLIPRSEFQYNWITSSLGSNYAVGSGKQRVYGYAPTDGIDLSASAPSTGQIGLGSLSTSTESDLDGYEIKYIISDGFGNTVTFQLVSDGSSAATGNTAVERDSGVFGGLHLSMPEGLKDAINASNLGITATRAGSTVLLTNDKLGRAGNVFIIVETDSSISVEVLRNSLSGMSNGTSTPIPALTFPSASEIFGTGV